MFKDKHNQVFPIYAGRIIGRYENNTTIIGNIFFIMGGGLVLFPVVSSAEDISCTSNRQKR